MERYIEHIYCNPASSHSSSSSTKFCDAEKQCSPCGCHRCCKSSFFNDHTYSILKRICHKIIKNYSRQRCRENYSVFDGGNSTGIRPLFKGQKDTPSSYDSYYYDMQVKSISRKNGSREKKNEDVSMHDIRKNRKGKRSDAYYENTNKTQDSTKPIVSGENNVGGENKKIRNGKGRDGKVKKIEVTVSKEHNDPLEDEPKNLRKGKTSSAEKKKSRGSNDANKEEPKQLRKGKGGTDYDKDGLKKSVGLKGSDGVDDLDEGLTKQTRRSKNLGDKKKKKSKDDQTEIEKSEDQGGKGDKKKKKSKDDQTKIEKTDDQGGKGDKKKKKSKDDQTKIEKTEDQGGINKYEGRPKNLGRGKRINEINQNILNGKENERDKHLDDIDGAINKLDKKGKKSIGGKGKGNNVEGYQAMSNKKGAEIVVKDQDDDKGIQNQHGEGKPDKIAKGLVKKNSEKSKIGSGKGSRHLRYADTHVIKGTRKRGHLESSKLVANRKLYSARKMAGLPRELQSCRYIRPCDVLRVKLEERDLSRCITCCSYSNRTPLCEPYKSCRPYQCGLPC